MKKTNVKSKKASAKKGQLDHLEALLNVANFLSRYKKWYKKYQDAGSTADDDGTTPGGPPPPPPQP